MSKNTTLFSSIEKKNEINNLAVHFLLSKPILVSELNKEINSIKDFLWKFAFIQCDENLITKAFDLDDEFETYSRQYLQNSSLLSIDLTTKLRCLIVSITKFKGEIDELYSSKSAYKTQELRFKYIDSWCDFHLFCLERIPDNIYKISI